VNKVKASRPELAKILNNDEQGNKLVRFLLSAYFFMIDDDDF